ncbi:secretin and TonB N-terminal domain-containing protein [Nitrosophilus alvini]|uniref:secretin and TonB N-terminal domain-containing protein n=1 Tax=Nitrosophilus alvini TaxID=2714855 RepID=UPI00190E3C1F|nr:secretin and TonB N-terminal domain-containing protein [Nitrosophilus alvini]
MAEIIRLIFMGAILIFFAGCSVKKDVQVLKNEKPEFKAYEKTAKLPPVPPVVMPEIYKKPSPFDNRYFTFSSSDASLSKVLYAIAGSADLNLVIDKDVPASQKITLNLENAPLKNALDTVMEITGCYYEINGNILHIKRTMTKVFKVPYIHTNSSYTSNLGGDVLGAASSSGSTSGTGTSTSTAGVIGTSGSVTTGGGSRRLSGDFSLKYENPAEANDFYMQLEMNIKELLSKNGTYTLNSFTGTLIVSDTKENIKRVESLIESILHQSNKGVLIEAKIFEVSLNKDHQLGIDWDYIFNNFAKSGTLRVTQTLGLTGAVSGALEFSGKNLNLLVQALQSSGTVETLSNPRIRVLSGQSALILTGGIIPFWEKKIDYTTVTSGTATTLIPQVTYSRRDVLEGISMGVTPIVRDDGTILLNIVPVSTTIEDIVTYEDGGQVVASAPKLNIKEAGTVIKAKDGDMIVIGGLINDLKVKKKDSVPVLSDFPLVGALFKRDTDTRQKKELVILLKLKVTGNE